MSATSVKAPGFHLAQRVSFVGGDGIVQSYQPEDGTWAYIVEMALGPEPGCGRVGAETMVLLSEEDLCGV